MLLFENEHRDFHTRLCTTKMNTKHKPGLLYYVSLSQADPDQTCSQCSLELFFPLIRFFSSLQNLYKTTMLLSTHIRLCLLGGRTSQRLVQ